MGLFSKFKKRDYAREFLDAYENNDADVCKSLLDEWQDSYDTTYDTNVIFAILLVNYLVYGKDVTRRFKNNFGMTINEYYHKVLLSPKNKPKNKKLASKYEAKVGALALMEQTDLL